MVDPTNDDAAPPSAPFLQQPDAQGQAALLLVESLIHGLIENSTLSLAQAIDIVATASEVKIDIADTASEHPAIAAESLRRLEAIAESLRIDLEPQHEGL